MSHTRFIYLYISGLDIIYCTLSRDGDDWVTLSDFAADEEPVGLRVTPYQKP